jgi:hypothetical protein
METATWVPILITAAGLYLGQSIRRKTRAEIEQQVAGRRLEAYDELWSKTPIAMGGGAALASAAAREKLYAELTAWYYEGGNGMVLSEQTRSVYLTAKANLVCAPDELQPTGLRDRVAQLEGADREAERGRASTRQFSLLRTSMRADLLVFTGPWGQRLDREDRQFLRACGVRQWRRPWRPSLVAAHAPEAPALPAPDAADAVPTA